MRPVELEARSGSGAGALQGVQRGYKIGSAGQRMALASANAVVRCGVPRQALELGMQELLERLDAPSRTSGQLGMDVVGDPLD